MRDTGLRQAQRLCRPIQTISPVGGGNAKAVELATQPLFLFKESQAVTDGDGGDDFTLFS